MGKYSRWVPSHRTLTGFAISFVWVIAMYTLMSGHQELAALMVAIVVALAYIRRLQAVIDTAGHMFAGQAFHLFVLEQRLAESEARLAEIEAGRK